MIVHGPGQLVPQLVQHILLGSWVFFSTSPAILVRTLVSDLDATRWSECLRRCESHPLKFSLDLAPFFERNQVLVNRTKHCGGLIARAFCSIWLWGIYQSFALEVMYGMESHIVAFDFTETPPRSFRRWQASAWKADWPVVLGSGLHAITWASFHIRDFAAFFNAGRPLIVDGEAGRTAIRSRHHCLHEKRSRLRCCSQNLPRHATYQNRWPQPSWGAYSQHSQHSQQSRKPRKPRKLRKPRADPELFCWFGSLTRTASCRGTPLPHQRCRPTTWAKSVSKWSHGMPWHAMPIHGRQRCDDDVMCEVAKCFTKVWRFRGLRLTIGGVNCSDLCSLCWEPTNAQAHSHVF